jgi:zinc protease
MRSVIHTNKLVTWALLGLASILLCFALSQDLAAQTHSPDEALPVDKNVTIGTLDNGLKYYIRVNHKPEKRALLRLVVNAGSVLENDDQQGLAHFTEHMAFNGTTNFAKQELVNYLESIGMRFGPEINGYTSFDETVYMLEVPTDSAGVVEKGIQILADWAHNISFDDAEIDKERGVVIEEWRLGQGAGMRMMQKELPFLLKNSKYADRIPIGKKEVLESFPHETLRAFYGDWYRPDLMAVIAVGDFDAGRIEALIKDRFSAIPLPRDRKPRALFPVPDHDEILAVVVPDPEATQTTVSIYHKLPVELRKTVADYRRSLIEDLYNSVLNARFLELTQKPDPPFVYAFSDKARFIRTKEFYVLGAATREDGIGLGLETILTEAERVSRFGFTQTEMDRQKDQMLWNYEKAYNERDKTESSVWAGKYVTSYLYDDPIPGIEYTYDLTKQIIPDIKLEEVNSLAAEWTSDKSNVVVAEAPEKEGLILPAEGDLLALMTSVMAKEITAYEDKVSQEPLVESPPVPSAVMSEKVVDDLGVREWTLANGVRVILKPTDFKNDEIQFRGFSAGGTSLAPDEKYVPAWFASTLVGLSGVGKFDYIELRKRLSGKVVNVTPYVDELSETVRGSASPKDIETMFQLIYLYFTSSRLDSVAYLSYKSRMEPWLKNKDADPEAAFSDTLSVTLSQYHPRRPVLTLATLDKMNLQVSYDFFKDRFADASDFTFVFVGAFDLEKTRPLVETYLGGLPSIRRSETWRDVGVEPPSGVIKKEVKKGIEPKSRVNLTFAGAFDWSFQNSYDLGSMADALRIKLREVIREAEGGTYDVSVGASSWKFPDEQYNVTIDFGCDPGRVNELTGIIFAEIDSLGTFPLEETYVTKVKEAQRREWEVNLKQNGFWLGTLAYYNFFGLPESEIMKYADRVEGLTAKAIETIAQRYLTRKNYVEVILLPEGK